MADRVIEYRYVDEVVPDVRNPKRHALGDLAASMARLGYVEPIVLDERTGQLVAGHGRTEALLAGQLESQVNDVEPPDGIKVDEQGRWLVPVVRGWSSKDDADAAAALVALNRLTEKGGWNDPDLVAILEDLATAADGPGLAGTGYDGDDLNLLLAEIAKRNPEPPAEFRQFDESIPTEHTCPRCSYTWSGKA